MVALDSMVSLPADVLFRELGGEAVLLNLQTGQYYGLNEVGTRLWMLLAENGDLRAACRALLAEYEVAEDQLLGDVTRLLDELATEGLVTLERESDALEP